MCKFAQEGHLLAAWVWLLSKKWRLFRSLEWRFLLPMTRGSRHWPGPGGPEPPFGTEGKSPNQAESHSQHPRRPRGRPRPRTNRRKTPQTRPRPGPPRPTALRRRRPHRPTHRRSASGPALHDLRPPQQNKNRTTPHPSAMTRRNRGADQNLYYLAPPASVTFPSSGPQAPIPCKTGSRCRLFRWLTGRGTPSRNCPTGEPVVSVRWACRRCPRCASLAGHFYSATPLTGVDWESMVFPGFTSVNGLSRGSTCRRFP